MPVGREVCFWCRKTKNITYIRNNLERDAVYLRNYDYCKSCREKYGEHILVFEYSEEPIGFMVNQPKFGNCYPTGHYVVVHRDNMEELIQFLQMPIKSAKQLRKAKRKYVAVPKDIFDALMKKAAQ